MLNRRQILERAAIILGGSVTSAASTSAFSSTWAGLLKWVEQPRATGQSVLHAEQQQIVSVFAELIIPTTDTPGAIAAGVPAFIDMMVSEWYLDNERQIFIQGVDSANRYGREEFGQSLLKCTAAQQKAALDNAMAATASYQPAPESFIGGGADAVAPFFFKLRELTLLGYYTSEIGCTQELRRATMPGRFDADVPLKDIGRAWATGIL